MHNPLVSIIIPAYNAERYIEETLDSVLAQDYSSLEIIVVDDGSTDNTGDIVKSYTHDSKIKYICKPNEGTAKTRNLGIKNSHGDYVVFLDSDDLLNPGVITLMTSLAMTLDPSICLIYGEKEHFDDLTDKTISITNLSSTLHNRKQLYTFRTNLILGSLIRREAINSVGGFNENVLFNEDCELLLKLSKHGKFYGLDKVIYRYRIRSDSKTQAKSHTRAVTVTEGRREYYKNILEDENFLTKAFAWGYHYLMAGVEFREFNKILSQKYFLISFLVYPFNLIPLRLLIASLRGRY